MPRQCPSSVDRSPGRLPANLPLLPRPQTRERGAALLRGCPPARISDRTLYGAPQAPGDRNRVLTGLQPSSPRESLPQMSLVLPILRKQKEGGGTAAGGERGVLGSWGKATRDIDQAPGWVLDLIRVSLSVLHTPGSFSALDGADPPGQRRDRGQSSHGYSRAHAGAP